MRWWTAFLLMTAIAGCGGERARPVAAPARERFSAAGLSWQMPAPPWRRYDWPLTSLTSPAERLSLGTFPLPRGPRDGNCTPRAAIDALPPDGAFIFILEYLEPAQDIPERTGEITLGPEEPHECLGESRTAIWRQAGRTFRADVYLGPRAGDRLRRDVRSILNSIEVG